METHSRRAPTLAAELDSAPGERFAYNNKATNLIAGVVERAAGKPLDALCLASQQKVV